MTMSQLVTFLTHTIGNLPQDRREEVRVLFHNPQDASLGVFENFAAWDGLETLSEIVRTAKALGLDNADAIDDLFTGWQHRDDADGVACPTCGNLPGDGVGCNDPNGCGYGADVDGTLDENERRAARPQDYDDGNQTDNGSTTMNSTDTTTVTTENTTACNCSSDTDARCASCLTSDVKKLSEESSATATFVEELREDLNEKMNERDVERAIEEAFEERDRDEDFVTERDLDDKIESALNGYATEDALDEYATSQALNDLDGSVNEMIEELAGEVRPWETKRAFSGVQAEGHTLYNGRTFTRRGIDGSSCTLHDVTEGYEHEYDNLVALLDGEWQRCADAHARSLTMVSVPGLPGGWRITPARRTQVSNDLQAGKRATFTPSGMGTGYEIMRTGGRFAVKLPAETSAFFGVTWSLYYMTIDCD